MIESAKTEPPVMKSATIARAFLAVACLILALLAMTPSSGAMEYGSVAQPVSATSGGGAEAAALMPAPSHKDGAEHPQEDGGHHHHHHHGQHCCGSSGCHAQIPYVSATERQAGAIQRPAFAEPAAISLATPPPGEPPKPVV